MKDYTKLLGMNKQNEDLLINAYDKGYNAGLVESAAYQEGLKDAWKCAKKIRFMEKDKLKDAFGIQTDESITKYIFRSISASEAVNKIKEYEEKQIRIGDEIKLNDVVEVVVSLQDTYMLTIDCYGHVSTWQYDRYPLNGWSKTGRHFPQIAELLELMKGVNGKNDRS